MLGLSKRHGPTPPSPAKPSGIGTPPHSQGDRRRCLRRRHGEVFSPAIPARDRPLCCTARRRGVHIAAPRRGDTRQDRCGGIRQTDHPRRHGDPAPRPRLHRGGASLASTSRTDDTRRNDATARSGSPFKFPTPSLTPRKSRVHHVVGHHAGGSTEASYGVRIFIVDHVVVHLDHLAVPLDHARHSEWRRRATGLRRVATLEHPTVLRKRAF